MKIFTIENRIPVLLPEFLFIQEFRAIWDRDIDDTKQRANKELAYVYFMEVFDSVYNQYDDAIKSDRIIADIIKPKKKSDFNSSDPLFISAREKFKSLQMTPTFLFYIDLEATLKKMQQAMKNLDFENDSEGKVMEKFMTIIKKSEESIISLNKIKEMVLREMTSLEKVRGSGVISNRERHPKDR